LFIYFNINRIGTHKVDLNIISQVSDFAVIKLRRKNFHNEKVNTPRWSRHEYNTFTAMKILVVI